MLPTKKTLKKETRQNKKYQRIKKKCHQNIMIIIKISNPHLSDIPSTKCADINNFPS